MTLAISAGSPSQERFIAYPAGNAFYALDGGAPQSFALTETSAGVSQHVCGPAGGGSPFLYSFSFSITNTAGLSLGTHTVTLTAESPAGTQFSDSATFTVSNTPPPPAQKTAELVVSLTNFNLYQGSQESGSSLLQNSSTVSGATFQVYPIKDPWIILDPPVPTSLNSGQSAPLSFHIDNTKAQSALRRSGVAYAASGPRRTISGSIKVNADGSGSGTTVTGTPQTVTVTYTLAPSAPVCSPTNIHVVANIPAAFSVSGGTSPYTWSAPGGNPSTSPWPNSAFSTTYTTPGSYTVTVTDHGGQTSPCSVTVDPAPPSCSSASASWTNKHDFCVGDSVTWSVDSTPAGYPSMTHLMKNGVVWTYRDSGDVTNYTHTYVYGPQDIGSYAYEYFTMDQGGQTLCTTNQWTNITVHPAGDPTYCPGPPGGPPSGYPQLQIDPTSLTVSQGDYAAFHAYYVAYDSSGNLVSTDVTNAGMWRSGNPAVAAPVPALPGTFTTVGQGNAAVSVSYSGLIATASLWVNPPPVNPQGLSCNTANQCVRGGGGASCASSADCGGGHGAHDFSINVTPATRNIAPGDTTTYTVSTQSFGGFENPVKPTVTGLPDGATGTLSAPVIQPGGSATLTVRTTQGLANGSYSFTVTGVANGATHATTASLNVCAGGKCNGPNSNPPGGNGNGGGGGGSSLSISCSFSASPLLVYRTNPWTTLNWVCAYASACTISADEPGAELGDVGINGSQRVQVATTTTYTLNCTNANQNQQFSTPVTVRVLHFGEINPGGQ